jgi:FdhD protein
MSHAAAAMSDTLEPVRPVRVLRINDHDVTSVDDVAAAEEPLDIRIHGESFAIVMRTPGADKELAAGFLFCERVIETPAELGAVEHCRHPQHPEVHHVVDVFLRGAAVERARERLARKRRVTSNSSCGICGRTAIDELREGLQPVDGGLAIDASIVTSLPGRLREAQPTFGETGGLHGAALFSPDGRLLSAAEDVGRHNAVDKIIGRMVIDERFAVDAVLMLSGRVSFEIVQKAWLARIPFIAAVSAPTSLAVDLAREAGITLVGFVRGEAFNVYSHEARVHA